MCLQGATEGAWVVPIPTKRGVELREGGGTDADTSE